MKWVYGSYLRKYFCPLGVNAISQPGGSGRSSATSIDWWRIWTWWRAGVAAPSAPADSCREAGDECERTCCTWSRGGWPLESVLDCREWEPESGSLKKDSGRCLFLQELGCGFMTELKSASRSVSRSLATWITCWPGKGWRGLMLISTRVKAKWTNLKTIDWENPEKCWKFFGSGLFFLLWLKWFRPTKKFWKVFIKLS